MTDEGSPNAAEMGVSAADKKVNNPFKAFKGKVGGMLKKVHFPYRKGAEAPVNESPVKSEDQTVGAHGDNAQRELTTDPSETYVGVAKNADGSLDYSRSLRLIPQNGESENEITIKPPEVGESPKTEKKGVADLIEHLKKLYPELNGNQRFEEWVRSQEQQNLFTVFSHDPSGAKTALSSPASPDVIVKRFDKGAERLGFEGEKKECEVAETYLGDRFLPETQFVEIEDATTPERKYYVLQDKVDGVHNKRVTHELGERVNASMSEDEIEEQYVQHPESWVKQRGEALREKLTGEQWEKVQVEAQALYAGIKALEQTHRINDLEFFITNEGKIKLIDFQVHNLATYTPDPDGIPEGSEEVKLLFDLPEKSDDT